jgi:indole-3-glycerol phosphate synthase
MLQDLYAGSVADAAARSIEVPASELEQIIGSLEQPKDVFGFLNAGPNINVIAEIKRASPSKGFLADIPDAGELASIYEQAGAACISVLTEERKFKGSIKDLAQVRARVEIPVLRKDFIANEYQILEARAKGADMVLLIVAGLNQPQLQRLYEFSGSLGLSVLVETHSKEEVQRANDVGAKIVGINARDLSTFETDLNLFGKLVSELPSDCIAVAESAVRGVADVEVYAEAGATCVLVGEALVTGDASSLIREFVAVPKSRIV